ELRKVVNHVIDTYGKPDEIRIELARDAKRGKKERAKINKKNRDREKERQSALADIETDRGDGFQASRDDITRMLLREECGGKCPYTGRSISIGALLGKNPQFQIEHIIPFSRSLDNSFLNKTLCYHETNYAKGNKTPYEAFADDPEWEVMLQRVGQFKGDARQEKLRRFKMRGKELETFIDDFKSSQLNDTRYASRLSMEYLRILYGSEWRKHIFASKGTITAELRNAWKLNRILNDGGEKKSRDDHRHHAVDAIAIALASPDMVKVVSQAAQMAEKEGHRRWWKVIQEPWDGFFADANASIQKIIVSHAPSRVVRGGLHKETNYSPDKENADGKRVVHVRKPLANMTSGEVKNIVDPVVREIFLAKRADVGKANPAEAFKNEANLPFHKDTKKGDPGKIIRRARIATKAPTIPVGKDERTRYVSPGNNHHIELFEITDKKGKPKWVGRVVSMYECCRRRAKELPVVDRTHPDGGRFVFSLCGGDMVEMLDDEGEKRLYVVRGISEFSSGALVLDFLTHTDARGISKVPRKGRTKVPNVMFALDCKKVTVSPLGEVRRAND
ncbi:MAG: type II CRISPR RNA-guided endonuclease Cas9, partial [Candidatus Hydrogenedentes bacterium]|nr:type II CRISPR RNA-guided endonuclease Cas9 [Candidatus Hydrogenedentota bacterium]